MPMQTQGYAAPDAKSPLKPHTFERRDVGPNDVHINIAYCGVCHSDVHQARDEWGHSIFPMVPGHEIVGHVAAVGKDVKKYKKGDTVGVGCFVNSCHECEQCKQDHEHFCQKGVVPTYNAKDYDGAKTYGGYSTQVVVDEKFVLSIPKNLPLDRAAPLLCAGITTYSPLKRYNVGKNTKLAVVGLGGLGHMAVKLGVSMGAEVTVLSHSSRKKEDALKMGAKHFEVVTEESAKTLANHYDVIIDTVSAKHNLNTYLAMCKPMGTMCFLGVPPKGPDIELGLLMFRNRQIAGSLVGGIAETQEMLDYCGKHNVMPDIETIKMSEINDAYERMLAGQVKYRFVIDAATIAQK